MSDLEDARAAWEANLRRLFPEIMRDPVAYALQNLAHQVFDAYGAELKSVREQRDRAYAAERQQTSELRAEIARLKAELDAAGHRSTLLCPASALMDAMDASRDEPEGTILRATDGDQEEYELKNRKWLPRQLRERDK